MRTQAVAPPHYPRAFTLIELLTVIAIICLLAAVLFPVLVHARRRAYEPQCISNLRQIGMAFRMYMQDYDNQRPEQLYKLVPAYLSTPQMLVCPADRTGNYAYLDWGSKNTTGTLWPYPQSYDYFQPNPQEWRFLEERGPQSGYLIDRNHDEAEGLTRVRKVPSLAGHTLRLNLDGSAVSREIVYPPPTVFDSWYLMNFNPGEVVPPQPQ
jgi:prepilin-type N-terminal cleavage/methylation domain-containing protein